MLCPHPLGLSTDPSHCGWRLTSPSHIGNYLTNSNKVNYSRQTRGQVASRIDSR